MLLIRAFLCLFFNELKMCFQFIKQTIKIINLQFEIFTLFYRTFYGIFGLCLKCLKIIVNNERGRPLVLRISLVSSRLLHYPTTYSSYLFITQKYTGHKLY